MKKWIVALACALVVLGCVGVACAEKWGDYEYRVLRNGNAVITSYNGKLKTVNIPSEIDGHPVTTIDEKAFEPAEYTLEKVIIPDSVVALYDCAFDGCSRLTEVTIPDSVTNLKGNPFRQCFNLKIINISANHPAIAVVEGVIFSKADRRLVCYPAWKGLMEYTVPQGIEIIGKNAFYNISSLEKVYLPDSVTEIQDSAFHSCNKLGNVTFPAGLTRIGDQAFFGCWPMTTLELSGSITEIGESAFCFCKLASVTIAEGDSELTIKKLAFSDTPIRKVEIHKDVSIENKGFYSCKNLEEIIFSGHVNNVGEEAFSFCSSLKKVALPGDFSVLESMAFFNCTALREVTLPDTVTTVKSSVFADCPALEKINLPRSITSITASNLFEDCPNVTVTVSRSSLGEAHCMQNNVQYVYEDQDSSPELSWLFTPAPAPKFCPECGYALPEGHSYKFCPECGHQL